MIGLILLVLAAISELVATVLGFNWIDGNHHYSGWIALGLFFGFCAVLATTDNTPWRRNA